MACYDFDYAMQILQQAIAFAEIEHDFIFLRKWASEVEQSGYEMKAIENRLNHPAQEDFLLITLQSVAAGSLSPEEAGGCIRLWLNSGRTQEFLAALGLAPTKQGNTEDGHLEAEYEDRVSGMDG